MSVLSKMEEIKDNVPKVYQAGANSVLALLKNPDWNQNDETQPDYIKNRLAYEVDEEIGSGQLENEQVEIQGSFVAGETIRYEITPAGSSDVLSGSFKLEYADEPTGAEPLYYVWSGEDSIILLLWNYPNSYVRLWRKVAKPIDEKYLPKNFAKSGETLPLLPVGTVLSEGYANSDERKMYALNKGTYYVRTGLALNIPEPCVCFVKIDEYGPSLEITTIDYMSTKFVSIPFDADSASINDGYEFPLFYLNLVEMLQDLSKTMLEHLWFMSSSGMPYKVSVDDDGKVIATPIE